MKAVYAVVETVKPVPSRGVTLIQLEVPMEDHVAITALLFGKTALVVPMELDGVRRYGLQDTDSPVAEARPREPGKPIAKLLGQWCKSDMFWGWLAQQDFCPRDAVIDSEEEAAGVVRAVCGVVSRGEIDGDEEATAMFQEHIRRPYMAYAGAKL